MLASVAPPAATAPGPAHDGVIVERPGPGLARGNYAWPPWGIALLGSFVLLVALLYFLLRMRRKRRAKP